MPRLTDRELDVMQVLWDQGSGTVTEVREHLDDELAYTTVLTVLRTLEQKGHVGHEDAGRAHRYHPLIDRKTAGRSAVSHLMAKLFDNSPERLLTHLVHERGLSRAEIRRLRRLLDQRLGEER